MERIFDAMMIPQAPRYLNRRRATYLAWTPGVYRGLGQFDWGGIDLGSGLPGVESSIQSTIDSGWQSLNDWIRRATTSQASGSRIDPVPTENQVTATVLAPVTAALQNPAVLQSAPTLQALWTFITNAERAWLNFLSTINWPEAATNARARLAPYFTGLESDIQSALNRLGSSTPTLPGLPGIPAPQPSTGLFGLSWTTIGIAAAAYYFLGRRR